MVSPTFSELANKFIDVNGRLPMQSDWGTLLAWWLGRGESGCTFATKFARDLEAANWEFYTVSGQEVTAFELEELIDDAYGRKVEALTIMLAGMSTDEQVAEFLVKLCDSPRWFLNDVAIEDSATFSSDFSDCEACGGDFNLHFQRSSDLNVGLRYRLNNQQTVWVLGASPSDLAPTTRRLSGFPFSVLFLRPSFSRDSDAPSASVHLCHMRSKELGLDKESDIVKWDKAMGQSKELRRKKLGGSPHCKAKAKVTFSLPARFVSFLTFKDVPTYEVDSGEQGVDAVTK